MLLKVPLLVPNGEESYRATPVQGLCVYKIVIVLCQVVALTLKL